MKMTMLHRLENTRENTTFLSLIRRAQHIRAFVSVTISIAFLVPAVLGFGLGHGRASTPDVTADFVVICTADGLARVDLDGENKNHSGAQCICAFNCAAGCCSPSAAYRGNTEAIFVAGIARLQKYGRIFSRHIDDGFKKEAKPIRAPPVI